MAMEPDGWGLAAMAKMAMGRVGNGASARWGATGIERDDWGVGGVMGACDLFGARSSRETSGLLERWA